MCEISEISHASDSPLASGVQPVWYLFHTAFILEDSTVYVETSGFLKGLFLFACLSL